MIKNVYFCVAKAKVDNPIGKFFLILLGTDQLEDIFGILQTIVGNDSTLDLLQLILWLRGTTEVSAILANHPRWDHSPWRLKLPVVSKDGIAIHKDVDYNDTAEDYDDGLGQLEIDAADGQPHVIDMELKETAIEEEETKKYDPCFELDGTKVWKSQYLSNCFKHLKSPGSHNWLKLYANVSWYAIKQDSCCDVIELDLSDGLQGSTINMDFPIATLLKCEGCLFICIGEMNNITFDSKHVDSLSVELLSEPSVFVSFQMLYLILANVKDSMDLKHDWKWLLSQGATFRVQGRLIEPINPDISTWHAGKPFYLFKSTLLWSLGTLLFGQLTCEDTKSIPQVKQLMYFLYCEESGTQRPHQETLTLLWFSLAVFGSLWLSLLMIGCTLESEIL